MRFTINLLCFIIAALLFLLSSFGVSPTAGGKPNLTALGLFFLTLALAI
jgi:hypothetical protein